MKITQLLVLFPVLLLILSANSYAQKHNYIVILADDLGTDKISAYGNELEIAQPQTPVLNKLFKQGVLFESAYSQVFCSPSRLSLMTGQSPHTFGVGIFIRNKDPRQIGLPLDSMTLPKAMGSLGYDSSHIGKWHMASNSVYENGMHPLKTGFKWSSGPGRNILRYVGSKKYTNGKEFPVPGYAPSDKIDDAIERVQKMQQPWVLYLPFNTPHHPFHVPPKELVYSQIPEQPTNAQKYDLMVEAMDHEIGRLIQSTPKHILANTTIVFMGDNGTPADGIEGKTKGPQRMKGSVYEGGVHVPLLVSGASVTDSIKGKTSDTLVSITDILPTIFELAGGDTQKLNTIAGVSFAGTINTSFSKNQQKRSFVFSERFEPNGPPPYRLRHRMVKNQGYKLIEKKQHGELKGYEFYNMKLDSKEQNNLCPCPENLKTEDDKAEYLVLKKELDAINKKAASLVIPIDPDPQFKLTTREFRKKKKSSAK